MNNQAVIEATRRWIASVVIGLNLCPFARRVFEANAIRYVVSEDKNTAELLNSLTHELEALSTSPEGQFETTMLIHPYCLQEFLTYNDFLDDADRLVNTLGFRGVIQIVSFHPGYQFADTAPDAVENYTNRSPYPMLHLLREESISATGADFDTLLEIPQRNIRTLKEMGKEQMLAKLKEIEDGL